MNSSPSILLAGSVAFDIIFSIPHDFRDGFLQGEEGQRSFSASYVANGKQEFFGGNAGNIAHWLARTNTRASIITAYGKDFEQKGYKSRLENYGHEIRGYTGDFSAHAYMVSDPLHQQMIIWQPNAYDAFYSQKLTDHYSKEELAAFAFAVFSPGLPNSFLAHLQEFRTFNKNATVFFDPGQVTNLFSEDTFIECCTLADYLVLNDMELKLVAGFQIPEHVTVIETLGENGVRLLRNEKLQEFVANPVNNVVESTGAGDAFRAGLLAELANRNSIEQAIQLGMQYGAECVQLPSGQQE